MSYSFQIRAANKAEAKQKVVAEFQKVSAAQACHKQDEAQALAAADAFIALVADDDTKDVVVTMHGSLSGNWSGGDLNSISGASVSVTAGQAARPPAATA